MFEQEKIARSLFRDILEYFEGSAIKPTIDIEGAGVHWCCILKFDSYKISIYSCDRSYLSFANGINEEFIISYFQHENEVCCGRTSDRAELIESAEEWLKHKSKEQLYRFEFVDYYLRKFQNLEEEWIEKFPELISTSRLLVHQGSGCCRYEISKNDRTCWSTGFGDHGELYFAFTWDGCKLFETESVEEETAEVLKRFLIDNEAPSALNKVFSWVLTNGLTESYEKGEGIKGEFIDSWDSIVRFYSDFPEIGLPNKKKIVQLIQDLKNQGFDKTIRAGQSLTTLILSRSRRHGLIEKQPFLAFEFKGSEIRLTTEKGEIDQFDTIQINERIVNLLKGLEKEELN